jgi:dinuclear metal center YbgI/SA1388 family protein
MELTALVAWLDEYLRTTELPDDARSINGLQVEGRRPIRRVAAGVDASEKTISDAVDRDCDLLIVHHGVFWGGAAPVTGRRYRKMRKLVESGMALYASHIPLDLHPEVGNNAVLARALGVGIEGAFGMYRGVALGCHGRLALLREALAARLDELLQCRVRLIPGGRDRIERVGIVTGAGSDMIQEAITLGLDALVTGEGPHHTYFDAMEGGLNVYYAGHYATETWGVRALAQKLEAQFGLQWEFIDNPTGL